MAEDRIRPSLDGELVSEVREAARSELATPPEKATVPAALRGLLRRVEELEEKNEELRARLGEDGTHDLAGDLARLHKAGRELRGELKPSSGDELRWKELRGEPGNHWTRQVNDPFDEIDVPEDAPEQPTLVVEILERSSGELPVEENPSDVQPPNL